MVWPAGHAALAAASSWTLDSALRDTLPECLARVLHGRCWPRTGLPAGKFLPGKFLG
jgi:hypothetical protein